MSGRRSPVALLAVAGGALLAGGLAAVPAGPVSAHAELESTTPPSGERLDASPPVIELRFTEDVQVVTDPVQLLTQTGETVELPEATLDGSVVTVSVPPLEDGGYVVDWQVVSADGHPISGAFPFSVGDAAPPDVADVGGDGADRDILWIWRAVTYAGFALVLGIWAFVLACWWQGRRDPVLGNLLTVGASLAVVGSVGCVLAEASVLEIDAADTFDLRSGKAWWMLVALAVLLLAVRPLLRTAPSPGPAAAGWAVAALAVGLAIAYAGHGAGGRATGVGITMTIVHVAAASVWVGGLVALLRVLRAEGADRAGVVARFSTIALAMVVVLGATGIVQAVRQLEETDAVLDSDFGQALLLKLAVVAALVVVAAVSRRRARRIGAGDVTTSSLRRLVAVEIALAAGALLATGWLAGESPAVADAGSSGPVTVTVTDTATGAAAIVDVDPAATGPNRVEVRITGGPGPVQAVVLDLAPLDGTLPAVRLDALELGAGYVVADGVDMELPGTWVLTIDARFGEFDQVTLTAEFVVTGG